MTRWDRRLARLLRALIACTVLLFAAQLAAGSAVAFGPARDVSAWVAYGRVASIAAAPVVSRVSLRQVRPVPVQAEPSTAERLQRAAPLAAAAPSDERHLYLELLTLLC